MYIGLNESVAVTDANGDHRVHCDAVGGQMAGGRGKRKKYIIINIYVCVCVCVCVHTRMHVYIFMSIV